MLNEHGFHDSFMSFERKEHPLATHERIVKIMLNEHGFHDSFMSLEGDFTALGEYSWYFQLDSHLC